MLYIVPTPIGNLEDMSPRAIRILKEVDYILAEDTRNSGNLLKAFSIDTRMHSYHAHNEHVKTKSVLIDLQAGKEIALISDAGTPGISDPGYLLVRTCHEYEIRVSCLPGPNALIPALVMSGLPCDRFFFEGFLPQKKGRKKRWEFLAGLECTLAFFESPHRIQRFIKEAASYLNPKREIALVKEVSKYYEKVYRGSIENLADQLTGQKMKGEFVVVIGKSEF